MQSQCVNFTIVLRKKYLCPLQINKVSSQRATGKRFRYFICTKAETYTSSKSQNGIQTNWINTCSRAVAVRRRSVIDVPYNAARLAPTTPSRHNRIHFTRSFISEFLMRQKLQTSHGPPAVLMNTKDAIRGSCRFRDRVVTLTTTICHATKGAHYRVRDLVHTTPINHGG